MMGNLKVANEILEEAKELLTELGIDDLRESIESSEGVEDVMPSEEDVLSLKHAQIGLTMLALRNCDKVFLKKLDALKGDDSEEIIKMYSLILRLKMLMVKSDEYIKPVVEEMKRRELEQMQDAGETH